MNEMNNHEQSSKTENRPFFSVIMPVYNAAPFLRQSVGSILSQDFKDWELIMVDDKSSDDSVAIMEELCRLNPKIRFHISSCNSGGAYSPRVRAAELAVGQYIVTIDADDLVDQDYLTLLHASIVSQDADLALTEMWSLTGTQSEKILPLDSVETDSIRTGRNLIGHTLVRWRISMNGFALRREIYLKAARHITTEDRKSIFADELLSRWILALSGKTVICKARYHYRQNAGSVTHINVPRIIESRMRTANGIISMTESTFGKDSPVYIRAIENKLYSAVDMLRLINASDLDHTRKSASMRSISSAMWGFDLSALNGKTSPRYLAIMRLPLPIARLILRILDSILRK